MKPLEGKVDLHFHTECSGDSYMPLYAIIPAALRLGLAAIAKTDHDSITGCSWLAEQALAGGVEFISAVELSTAEHWHVLGYYVDTENPGLLAYTETEKAYGRRLLRANVAAWKDAGGAMPNDIDGMLAFVRSFRPGGEISLKQVADFLASRGFYPDAHSAVEDAGEKLKGFVPPPNTPPPASEAVKTVLNAGGVAVFAHPHPRRADDVERLLDAGLAGVEGLNVKALAPEHQDFWRTYCSASGLALTGGTDHHGMVEYWNVSYSTVADYSAVQGLKDAVRRIHGRKV
ncbi:MAG TPA: PHP domain-containing protein [Planctomycetes bacterium]|nr:PHP domain-containing protein [Planctomycetota bacterium]